MLTQKAVFFDETKFVKKKVIDNSFREKR